MTPTAKSPGGYCINFTCTSRRAASLMNVTGQAHALPEMLPLGEVGMMTSELMAPLWAAVSRTGELAPGVACNS